MKKLAVLLLMLCPLLLFAQTGKVYDNLTLTSKILKSERKYAVYLPPDYETSGRSTPYFTCCMAPATTKPAGYNLARC
jgi:hypothetical protein